MDLVAGALVTPQVVLVRLLGEGGMGSVWLAEHRALMTEVAVKFIAADAGGSGADLAGRLVREARAAARLSSPHVVKILDQGVTASGLPFIVMELLRGESLGKRLKRLGALPADEVAVIVKQVAKALAEAHDAGLVHRDIKPDNLLILASDEELFVKVLDFGIAKDREELSPEVATKSGMLLGTPFYMSPEHITKAKAVDHGADLWALAVVAYEALTGERPFKGETIGALIVAIVNGEHAPPTALRADLPPAVDGWFERAFCREASQRFASAKDLAQTLSAVLSLEVEGDAATLRAKAKARGGVGEAATLPADTQSQTQTRVETLGGAANTLRRGPFPSPARIAAVAAVIGSSIIALALLARHGAESARAPQIAAPLPRLSYSVPPLPPPPPPVPPELVAVPAGRYYIGCHHRLDRRCWDDEKPGRLVEIGAFSLMRREVSASEYAACVAASACPQREDKAGCTAQDDTSGRPANCVTWPAAASYCRFRGWRLPTELEWEAAARGSEHPDYPWGNEPPSCERTVIADARADGCGSGAPLPVLARKADVSWVGAHDMGGSLREWTATEYGPYPNGKADPAALGKKVTRGGSWIMRPGEVATSHTRGSENSGAARTDLGFRCAK